MERGEASGLPNNFEVARTKIKVSTFCVQHTLVLAMENNSSLLRQGYVHIDEAILHLVFFFLISCNVCSFSCIVNIFISEIVFNQIKANPLVLKVHPVFIVFPSELSCLRTSKSLITLEILPSCK